MASLASFRVALFPLNCQKYRQNVGLIATLLEKFQVLMPLMCVLKVYADSLLPCSLLLLCLWLDQVGTGRGTGIHLVNFIRATKQVQVQPTKKRQSCFKP